MAEHSKLGRTDTQKIQTICRQKLAEFGLMEDDDVWGFFETIDNQDFVCINISLAYDKQVFAAAHELYHLWFGNASEVILSENMLSENDQLLGESEAAANRFAAEFLVNEGLLLRQIDIYVPNRKDLDVKAVLRLANQFLVPYKTMVHRLNEIGVLRAPIYMGLFSVNNQQVEIWRRRLGLSLPKRENPIGLSTLVDVAMDLYEKDLITYEKLTYLLDFAQITPEDVGIKHLDT